MCTAIAYGSCFGRNLDLEYGYNEQVVIMPPKFPLSFRYGDVKKSHYAMVGTAVVAHDYPLFFDACNEKGLCMAGLDFPDNAYYPPSLKNEANIAPFELIPWVLCQCASVAEARNLLQATHLSDIPYSESFPQAPLHWMIADSRESIVLEPTKEGMKMYDNPIGVLTNNPPFPYHMDHLIGYQHLRPGEQELAMDGLALKPYGGGLGAIGLPGDFSSPSRFIKAAFVKVNSRTENDPITQFFHLLDAVTMPRGAVRVRGGKDEITRYSCCCDMTSATYYFTTYDNRRIRAVKLYDEEMDPAQLKCFPLYTGQDVHYQN